LGFHVCVNCEIPSDSAARLADIVKHWAREGRVEMAGKEMRGREGEGTGREGRGKGQTL